MSEASESLTLKVPQHDKLGNVHCGVIREGLVSVAGDIATLSEGETIKMSRGGVTVTRRGDEYKFDKQA